MRNVVVGHGENRDLCDGPSFSFDPSGSFVDRRQVRVHISRVAAAAWYLLTRRGNLSQSFAIIRHVREYNEHVQVMRVGEVLCNRQSTSWSGNALNRRVICQIHEEYHAPQCTSTLKILHKE